MMHKFNIYILLKIDKIMMTIYIYPVYEYMFHTKIY